MEHAGEGADFPSDVPHRGVVLAQRALREEARDARKAEMIADLADKEER